MVSAKLFLPKKPDVSSPKKTWMETGMVSAKLFMSKKPDVDGDRNGLSQVIYVQETRRGWKPAWSPSSYSYRRNQTWMETAMVSAKLFMSRKLDVDEPGIVSAKLFMFKKLDLDGDKDSLRQLIHPKKLGLDRDEDGLCQVIHVQETLKELNQSTGLICLSLMVADKLLSNIFLTYKIFVTRKKIKIITKYKNKATVLR